VLAIPCGLLLYPLPVLDEPTRSHQDFVTYRILKIMLTNTFVGQTKWNHVRLDLTTYVGHMAKLIKS